MHRLATWRFLVTLALFVSSFSTAQAALYAPGATLDPSCGPSDLNCGVESVVGAGTVGQIPYYAADGSVLSASNNFTALGNGNVNGSIWANQYTESSNSQYNPASNALNGQSDGTRWIEAGTNSLPSDSLGYGSAVVYDGKMWLLGGWNDTASTRNVYYSTDGTTWASVGSNTLPRDLTGASALVYGGKMWLIGGSYSNGSTVSRKVYYSTDGVTWTEAGTDALPSPITSHSSVVFNGKMWVVGGGNGWYGAKAYYSTDGITWTEAGTDALPVHTNGFALLVYNNKMWMIGGATQEYGDTRKVWSSPDGITWTEAGTDALPIRIESDTGANGAVVYDGKMWLLGGWANDHASQKALYSTDGATWTEAGSDALPIGISGQESVVYNGRIWLLGGYATDHYTGKAYYSAPTVRGGLSVDNTVTSSGSELVSNGSFTGSASSWTLGSDVTYGSNHVTSTYAGGDPSFSTTFSTVAGETYLLSFDVSNVNGPLYFYFDHNSFGSSGPFTDGKVSTAFTTSFTGTETIHFDDWAYHIGDTWTIDNVSVKKISSPAAALTVKGYDGKTWLSLGDNIAQNTGLGSGALSANTSGFNNTGIGWNALKSNIDGTSNVAVGTYSLFSNTSGSFNTTSGTWSLFNNTTGSSNTGHGFDSLYLNTTGSNNSAFGRNALFLNTTGDSNTALGYQAGFGITTGTGNVLVGTSISNPSKFQVTSGSNNIALGYDVAVASSTANNQLVIGNLIYGTGLDGTGASLSSGNLGVSTTSPWRKFSVAGTVGFSGLTGSSGAGSLCLSADNEVVYNSGSDSCLPSLRSLKHDISILQLSGTSTIMALDPVSFIYNYDASNTVRYGFIAEDTSKVDSHLGTYDIHGNLSGVDDRSLIAILVKAIKEMLATITGFSNHFRTNELCVGDTCITENDLKSILQKENITTTGGSSSGTWTDTSTPVSPAASSTEVSETASSTLQTDASSTPEVTAPPATDTSSSSIIVDTTVLESDSNTTSSDSTTTPPSN